MADSVAECVKESEAGFAGQKAEMSADCPEAQFNPEAAATCLDLGRKSFGACDFNPWTTCEFMDWYDNPCDLPCPSC